jgi:hypothetical protein
MISYGSNGQVSCLRKFLNRENKPLINGKIHLYIADIFILVIGVPLYHYLLKRRGWVESKTIS